MDIDKLLEELIQALYKLQKENTKLRAELMAWKNRLAPEMKMLRDIKKRD